MENNQKRKEIMRLAGIRYYNQEPKEPGFFSKNFTKTTNEITKLKDNFNTKIDIVKNFFQKISTGVKTFVTKVKLTYEGWVIEKYHPYTSVKIRNQFVALKERDESLREFLERKGYNPIYNKLLSKNKSEFEFDFFAYAKSLFNKKKKSVDKDFYRILRERMEKKNIFGIPNQFKKSWITASPNEKSPYQYQDLGKESADWCVKLKQWEKDSIQERRLMMDKRGMSLVDFLLFKDKKEGRVLVWE